MGRAPCCDKSKVKKGPWSPDEDDILRNYIQNFGTGGNWIALPSKAGLKRCGKSCRLRWLNYLRPDIKHGGFTNEEDNIIYALYDKLGSRWSVIASHLPGRTDNDVKNHWNTKLKKQIAAHVSTTNLYETNFENPANTNFSFQSWTCFGALIPETISNFSPNSNISTLVDESSPSMANTYSLNFNCTQNSTYTTLSPRDNILGSCSIPVENNMLGYGNLGAVDLGFSENFEAEVSHAVWSQEVISEFGSFNYPDLGNNLYQGVTNQYVKIED